MKKLLARTILLSIPLLSATFACRDRDAILAPAGEVGRLTLAVTFDSVSAAAVPLKLIKTGTRSAAPLAQARDIQSIHAQAYDESPAGAGRLLADSDLSIDRQNGTFSGSLEVAAGDSRVVAVQAVTARGIEWLGASAPLTVTGGGSSQATVVLRNYLPVIEPGERVSQTGDFSLTWTAVPAASAYVVQIAGAENFSSYDSITVQAQTVATVTGKTRGMYFLRVRASSRYGYGAASDTVAVKVTRPPEVQIISPAEGAVLPLGVNALFLARAFDQDDGYLSAGSVTWTSNRDGRFAQGAFVLFAGLSVGAHTVVMSAVNSFGAAASDTVAVTVASAGNGPPSVIIEAPADSSSFNSEAPVLFLGSGTDPEDGSLADGGFYWVSSRDGYFGKGAALNYPGLSLGDHIITLIGTDSQGAAAASQILLRIVSTGGSQAPSARIVSPAEGAAFAAGSGIYFSAEVQGVTAREAQAGRVWWSSSLAGRFAVGLAAVEHGLPLGSQTVYLTAVGEQGAAAQDSVKIQVTSATANSAPLATILSPVHLAGFPSGAEIVFLGRGVDLEDGVLAAPALTWVSSLAG
ncbi:MAG: hypothetical protein V1794_08060, partial [Candidatus Glassbacteria bacterium]